ncbi:MAG: phytoene desaturase [Deltaproteobacteria bacterium]|nr:phytoene desaturase [Deltaproteobacteria bacterium]
MPRAAIVGAGFGGLAAAIRLQAAGVQTVLYEAADKAGGRAYVFEDKGFTFDAGPTVLTVPESIEELFSLAGERMSDHVELIPIHPFYRLLWNDGDRFDYDGDTSVLLEQIRKRNPKDAEGYLRFYEYSRRNYEAGYEGLASAAFLKLWDMLRVAPTMAGLRSDRSVYSTVARFVEDDRLRQALSFHTLLIGGNPFETSSIYTMIHYLERKFGVWFARGGTGALVRALTGLYERLGGDLRLSTPVERIDVGSDPDSEAQITTSKGDADLFDVVVSNADLHHTYAKLLGHDPRGQTMRKKLERMEWSMSLFVLYFGTDRTWPDVAHHSILFGDRYEALLHDIFHGSKVPDDFSLYLHAPSVTDPSLAPAGCSTFYVLSPVPHLGKANVDWERLGPVYADKLIDALDPHLPGLRDHIVVQRTMTPEDFRQRLGAWQGAAFSVAPLLTQSAWFRPHNRDPRIPQLYIAGAGTHPGAGVPGVINSAKATVRLILEDLDLPVPSERIAACDAA